MSARICKRCGEEKEISDFPIDKRNIKWQNNICKRCNGIRNNFNGKPFKKKWNWQRRGWPEDEIAKAEEALKSISTCTICNEVPLNLHVDHCHITNKFRGILCHKCNRALGFFKDSPTLLRKAADYVEQLDSKGKVVYH